MDIDQVLLYWKIPQFYYPLHNILKPNQHTMQEYIRKNDLKHFFPVAIEYKPKKFKYALLKNMQQYIFLYESANIIDRNFYAVYLYAPRYLYLDIDCVVKSKVALVDLKKEAKQLIYWLCHRLNMKMNNFTYQSNKIQRINFDQFAVFDSSRYIDIGEYKISIHVFNPNVVWYNIDNMIQDIKKLKTVAQKFNIRLPAAIDLSVYKKLQLMRMPECYKNGDRNSRKKLLFGPVDDSKLSKLIELNQVDYIEGESRIWQPFVNISFRNTGHKLQELKQVANSEFSTVVRCIVARITNDKCYSCTASDTCNKIVQYEFESSINKLHWMEERCLNQACKVFRYESINSNVKYPRTLANIPLSIDELEGINVALKKFGIDSGDQYKFIFRHDDMINNKLRIELQFHDHVLQTKCKHEPRSFYIKNKKHAYYHCDGKYTIQCNKCPPNKRWSYSKCI